METLLRTLGNIKRKNLFSRNVDLIAVFPEEFCRTLDATTIGKPSASHGKIRKAHQVTIGRRVSGGTDTKRSCHCVQTTVKNLFIV